MSGGLGMACPRTDTEITLFLGVICEQITLYFSL